LRVKRDPESRASGIPVVNEHRGEVAWVGEDMLQSADPRSPRYTRSRPSRFANRCPKGWLAPFFLTCMPHVLTRVQRLSWWCPVGALAMELLRFNMPLLQNRSLEGVESQRRAVWKTGRWQYMLTRGQRRVAWLEIAHAHARILRRVAFSSSPVGFVMRREAIGPARPARSSERMC
jgi:hypothetical protein